MQGLFGLKNANGMHSGLEKYIWNDASNAHENAVEMQGSRHEWSQKMHLECHSGLEKYICVITNDEPNAHEIAFEMQRSLHE